MGILKLKANSQGRDYVVGDIHGHFELLDQLLKTVDFDADKDRLISVGDLVDRGPDSERALEYFAQPWFYAVRGNHEELLLASQRKESGVFDLWMRVGGFWAQKADESVLHALAEDIAQLPYLIEIDTQNGPVGVVHADVPTSFNWASLTALINSGKLSTRDKQVLTWSRERFRRLRMYMLYPGAYQEHVIDDIYRVYVGHNIVDQPTLFGNVMFIDTGAFCGGQLTLVDLNSEEIFAAHADN
jgi:serine/threonine protein phosphatase 1